MTTVSPHEFIADWTQMYPILNIVAYLRGYNLTVSRPKFINSKDEHFIYVLPRGTPVDNFQDILESISLLKRKRKSFLCSQNFKRIGFDNSEWSSIDGRVRLIIDCDSKFTNFEKFRVISFGVLRLIDLIDDITFKKEILHITTLRDNVVVDYRVQERTFIFIKFMNKI